MSIKIIEWWIELKGQKAGTAVVGTKTVKEFGRTA